MYKRQRCNYISKSKYRYYILTSSDIFALQRHFSPEFSAISKEKAVVVINTKDKQYEKECSEWCLKSGIEFHITKSNGTPARGKNLLIDIFLKSDDDYMVQIDGDDYLTPHGVWLYDYVSNLNSPPDAICLKNQISKRIDYPKATLENIKDPNMAPTVYVQHFTADWESIENFDMVGMLSNLGVDKKSTKRFAKYHKNFYRLQKKYCDDNETHCRVTWISKKAFDSGIRFPENLLIGEDTIFYLSLIHI